MPSRSDFQTRLYEIMKFHGWNKTLMGEAIGVTNFGKYLSADGQYKPENLSLNLANLGISLDWYYTGKGEMFLANIHAVTDSYTIALAEAAIQISITLETITRLRKRSENDEEENLPSSKQLTDILKSKGLNKSGLTHAPSLDELGDELDLRTALERKHLNRPV